MGMISILSGLILAGQSGAARLPEDWPLKILDAPRAEVRRTLGQPTDAFESGERPVRMDFYSWAKVVDVSVTCHSGRVRRVWIDFATPPKDWREALATARIAAHRARSARATRQGGGRAWRIEGLAGLPRGWSVFYSPARRVLEGGVPRDDLARLEFVAPGLRKS